MKRKIFMPFLVGVLLITLTIAPSMAGFASGSSSGSSGGSSGGSTVIKNVIYMIPDGGGMALFDFSNAVKSQGGFNPDLYPNSTQVTAGPMNMKDYFVGTVITNSHNGAVTDSAAAGTALSSGYKTINNYVGIAPNQKPRATILEAAQLSGKKAGIVSTAEWSHATPASFTAHNISRTNYPILSEQIVNQGLDVVLGTGFGLAQWGSLDEARNRGYTVVSNKTQLNAICQGEKVWGNLSGTDSMPFDINLTLVQPTLAEMTSAAIRALDNEEEGFFLMVEGSKVDYGGHNNNIKEAVSEYLAFDAAFKVAVDYAKTRSDTIVVAVPDHDTGGLALPGADTTGGNPDWSAYADAVTEVAAGINSTNGISWETQGHTGRKCGIWIYVPDGIQYPQGLASTPKDTPQNRALVIDNTEIAPYLASLMGFDLSEATEALFNDVTDMGTYDANSGVFTFFDYDMTIKVNTSTAKIQSEPYFLDGQIAVYTGGRFYVPRILFDIYERVTKTVRTDVTAARYIDNLTGRVLVKGQVDKSLEGKSATLLLCKKGTQTITPGDVGGVGQVTIGKNGLYVFTFTFKGNVNEYELRMYLGNERVDDSLTVVPASYAWLDALVSLTTEKDILALSEIEINNYYDLEGLTYVVALFFYDDNDQLVGVRIGDGVKSIGDGITKDKLNAELEEGTTKVKAAVWSNLTSIIPLGEAATIVND
ncbi:MAG: alkaline phosphatase [Eubacteriales bacterium]|nr:alkaline phosphatase [Eubacteriales bacterium]